MVQNIPKLSLIFCTLDNESSLNKEYVFSAIGVKSEEKILKKSRTVKISKQSIFIEAKHIR